jgi:dynein assembly factor 3
MVDRFGAVTWWGFSPALDLLDEGKTGVTIVVCSFTCLVGVISLLEKLHLQESGENSHKVINILLIGSGDIRHILKTVTFNRRHVLCN